MSSTAIQRRPLQFSPRSSNPSIICLPTSGNTQQNTIRTISVLVEKGEGLLEFGNLFFGKLISHGESVLKVFGCEWVFVLWGLGTRMIFFANGVAFAAYWLCVTEKQVTWYISIRSQAFLKTSRTLVTPGIHTTNDPMSYRPRAAGCLALGFKSTSKFEP
jgi:hypothetical protein